MTTIATHGFNPLAGVSCSVALCVYGVYEIVFQSPCGCELQRSVFEYTVIDMFQSPSGCELQRQEVRIMKDIIEVSIPLRV